MRADEGDWLVVPGGPVGSPHRRGRIMEVRGPAGQPPFVVRWLDTERESLVFPGPEAVVVTRAEQDAADRGERHRLAMLQQTLADDVRRGAGQVSADTG